MQSNQCWEVWTSQQSYENGKRLLKILILHRLQKYLMFSVFSKIWKLMTAKNSCWEKWLDCGTKVLTQGTKLVHSLWEKFLICSAHKLLNQLFIYQGTILDFMKRHWSCGTEREITDSVCHYNPVPFKCVWLLWKPLIFNVYTQIKTEFMKLNFMIRKTG
jgi:hypothetical protein